MVNRKTASALTIAALLACAVPSESVASLAIPLVAQAAPSFPVPDAVPKETKLSISSSSDNMKAISETLGAGFKQKYSGGQITVATKDANTAIQDVLNGSADLAAISRPLTDAEKAQGLIAVPVRREKIAIVVGKDNPFKNSITGSQFAQIFRGEIKDWSEVGGPAGAIRFIDRPDTSETRQALQPYPVFTTAEFKTGSNATALSEDSTPALAKALGRDGVGYVLVGQLEGQPDIRALELHKTLPSDPRYPFSQPYSFVYAGGASPAVKAFLGYATGDPGQAVLNNAQLTGYGVIPEAGKTGAGAAGTATANAPGQGSASAGTDQSSAATASGTPGGVTGGATTANGQANASGNSANGGNAAVSDGGNAATGGASGQVNGDGTSGAAGLGARANRGRWWWLLLPLAGLGLLIWAAGKRGSEEETGYMAASRDRDDEDRIAATYSGRVTDRTMGSVDSGFSREGSDGSRVGRAIAGGTALAGGAAAAGAGLAGRFKNADGDVTMDLQEDVSNSVQGGIDSARGTVQGGLGNLRSNIQEGIEEAHTNLQGGIDGVRTRIQGSIDETQGTMQGSIDGVRTHLQTGVDNLKGTGQDGIDEARTRLQGEAEDTGNWLDRAKQRINEATEQIKDTASDIKDDIMND